MPAFIILIELVAMQTKFHLFEDPKDKVRREIKAYNKQLELENKAAIERERAMTLN